MVSFQQAEHRDEHFDFGAKTWNQKFSRTLILRLLI